MRDGARRPTLKAPFPHCHLLSLRSLSVHLRRLPDARGDHSPGVKKHLSHPATFSFSLQLHSTSGEGAGASSCKPSALEPGPASALRIRSGGGGQNAKLFVIWRIFALIFEVLLEVIFMPFSGPQILHCTAPEKGGFPIFGKKGVPDPPPGEVTVS